MASSSRSIILTPAESTFVRHLDEYAQSCTPPVECRIAGGWVRDKLLALPSSDLDIALTTSSGHAFAVGFVDYLRAKAVVTGSVGKVAVNPEQSKHLETGTTKIMGLECDFVGLRSETYTDSRIPHEIKLGTPLEDALRRDLTINALFYNVHSQSIEDHTGFGLDDLSRKIARTPLPPLQTFHDDPLRVLRCVRFASRFDLHIQDDVTTAIKQEDVQSALRSKVSEERIGIEVTKMLKHNPLRSLALIDELGLHSSIFDCGLVVTRRDAFASGQILQHILERQKGDDMLWFAAATSPFRDQIVKGKKEVPAVSVVLGDSLKLSNEIKFAVTNLFASAHLLDMNATKRSSIGNILRLPQVRPWERSVIWAAVVDILPSWRGMWDESAERTLSKYRQFIDRVHDLGLPSDLDRPPLLDGKKLQSILELRPSPILSVILKDVVTWQLDHPDASAQDCEAWVKQMWAGAGRIEWEAKAPPPVKAEKRKR